MPSAITAARRLMVCAGLTNSSEAIARDSSPRRGRR
jgi:hypothetical protein